MELAARHTWPTRWVLVAGTLVLAAPGARAEDASTVWGTVTASDLSATDASPTVATDGAPEAGPELPDDLCASIGAASAGWLVGGVQLETTDRILTRPGRNWGTPEAVERLRQAVDAVHERFPGTRRLFVGDISLEGGGPMRPHASHQSGRDADVGYFHRPAQGASHFREATSKNLDLRRTWALIEALMEGDAVEYIFIDYGLQALLHDYARRKAKLGARELSRLFAYPRGRRARVGIIRHSRGHRDHMHVRFRSPQAVAAARAYVERVGEEAVRPVPVRAKVRRGDTLGHIARRHRTSVRKLLKWNGIGRKTLIHPGQSLVVGWGRPELPPIPPP